MSDAVLIAIIAGGFGLTQAYLIRRSNEIHVLVNSKMTTALEKIGKLEAALALAENVIGEHDAPS